MALRSLLGLGGFLLLSFAAAALGGTFTGPAIASGWYAELQKPPWTPPSWVFGPAWTVLYALMAVAAFRIWRVAEPGRVAPLVAYGVQLVLNVAWSALFFGLRRPALALVEIVLLEVAIVVTLVLFAKRDRVAGWLLVPYALWVAYAATINAGVVVLER
jgi:translocator protein